MERFCHLCCPSLFLKLIPETYKQKTTAFDCGFRVTGRIICFDNSLWHF